MDNMNVYSKMYFARIIVENDWGYHLESMWYGADVRNMAAMIMDMMGSWYLPNKEVMNPQIVDFYTKLEKATAKLEDGEKPEVTLSFRELTGEMFRANGLRMEIITTNNLLEMFDFIANETFNIFAANGEKPDDFASIDEFVNHFNKLYDIDERLVEALRNPNEVSIMNALYSIDLQYQYMQRHYRNPQTPQNQ